MLASISCAFNLASVCANSRHPLRRRVCPAIIGPDQDGTVWSGSFHNTSHPYLNAPILHGGIARPVLLRCAIGMMDDQKLIEQLQNELESYEHDTQELKRKNAELQRKLSSLLQREQKSEALRSQLELLVVATDSNDDLSKRLRELLDDFKASSCKQPAPSRPASVRR